MDYRVELDGKIWKEMQKSPHSGHFLGSSLGIGMLCFSILTSFRILAITYSFQIRFEWFKFLVKIDFKENKTYGNRHRKILIISGLKIYSK